MYMRGSKLMEQTKNKSGLITPSCHLISRLYEHVVT